MTDPHILLVAIGSHGDVHPFVGLGVALRARGHRVSVITNGHFETLVRRAGLEFIELGTAEQYRELATNPDLWHPTRAWKVVFLKGLMPILRPMYRVIEEHYIPGRTVVAASTLAFGARVAQDKLGVPTVTVHLSPSVFRTNYDVPLLPGSPIRAWMPRWVKRRMWDFADRAVLDPAVGTPLNEARAELGLPPVTKVMDRWWHSPQRVIGLFPDWFGPPQPDWPEQTRLTGFPRYDERGLEPMPASLERFLDDEEPPIAFTPGSAMWAGHRFFEAAVDACRRLKRRGLLLTRHTDHLPADLPPGVIHVPYAPFSELLPRCAALVHHGGIGTCSQALAAGIPQLVTPMSHDQPDNALRLERLGVARSVKPRQLRVAVIARRLRQLLDSPETARRCREIASRFAGDRAVERTCELIEEMAPSVRPTIATAETGVT